MAFSAHSSVTLRSFGSSIVFSGIRGADIEDHGDVCPQTMLDVIDTFRREEVLGAIEGHARALTDLTGQSFWAFLPEATKQECLECHSADFRIMKEAGKAVTSADVKYGITCVGCHSPHEAGTIVGKWDEEFDAQLNNDASLNGNSSNLCIECHNGEIPVGSTASPGAEIHHPMREMMDGYGAIDVSAFPSVHKGKCVQCHMPPTSWSRGNVQLAGNHTFNIITPEDAVEASLVPVVTATAVATATPVPAGTPVITTTITVTRDSMPYSACSTCHYNNNGLKKSPMPVSTTTATPTPGASPLRVTVTLTQNANETPVGNLSDGDKALWLQDTIDQRRSRYGQDRRDPHRAQRWRRASRLCGRGSRPGGPRGHTGGRPGRSARPTSSRRSPTWVTSRAKAASVCTTGTTRARSSTWRSPR